MIARRGEGSGALIKGSNRARCVRWCSHITPSFCGTKNIGCKSVEISSTDLLSPPEFRPTTRTRSWFVIQSRPWES